MRYTELHFLKHSMFNWQLDSAPLLLHTLVLFEALTTRVGVQSHAIAWLLVGWGRPVC